MSANTKVLREYTVGQYQEICLEVVSKTENVYLTLKSGYAEIFGSNIVKQETYQFTAGAKIAVFSCDGCVLQVEGETRMIYTSEKTPMFFYSSCHLELDFMRIEAQNGDNRGPIAMIVGERDVGKKNICRYLSNYATRMGRRPICVDLDVEQGETTIPGTIGARVVERHAPVGGGFSEEAPLVYNFGHKSPQDNIQLFNMLVNQLAITVKGRLEADKGTITRSSGVIINTCGWTKYDGYTQLLATAEAFEVDVIIVVDQDTIYDDLVRDAPSCVRKIISLPKSGGVLERSECMRAEASGQKIREYFYGTSSCPSNTYSFDVHFSDVDIYKIGILPVPASSLPYGMEMKDHMTRVVFLKPNARLLHHILAVIFAGNKEEVITSCVIGFVCVTNVDEEKQLLTLLSSLPEPLPTRSLVLSEVQFVA